MALVDTQGFVMAVDRSLFGPQGRRWIERKLPDVVTNLAFIGVSAVGALMLAFHVSCGRVEFVDRACCRCCSDAALLLLLMSAEGMAAPPSPRA